MRTSAVITFGIDVEITVDGGAYAIRPNGPFMETGMAIKNVPGP